MALGPGKYDEECTRVRESTGAAGVVVMVIGGNKGNGFAVQADAATTFHLPDLLESMAKQIRASLRA